MSITGLLNAVCYLAYAGVILYILIERRKVYRLNTKLFFSAYSIFLILRAITLVSEPVTGFTVTKMVISVAILYPLILILVRLMRLGDPFQLSTIVSQLREQLREQGELQKKIEEDDISFRERMHLEKYISELEKKITQMQDRLTEVLRITKDGSDGANS